MRKVSKKILILILVDDQKQRQRHGMSSRVQLHYKKGLSTLFT